MADKPIDEDTSPTVGPDAASKPAPKNAAGDQRDLGEGDKRADEGAAPETIAHKIWQAGLGAYGRALGETAGNMAKISGGTSKLFEELARKGEALEEASQAGAPNPGRQSLFDRPPLEERLSHLKAVFGFTTPRPDNDDHEAGDPAGDDDARIAQLEAQVAALRAEVAALMDEDGSPEDTGE